MMHRALRPWIACACALACSGEIDSTAQQQAPPPADPLSVYVVNEPLAYFAARVGGDRVAVSFPAPQDLDPAEWSPPPEVVAAYQNADLVLLNGAGYAGWVTRATLPREVQIDTSSALRDRLITRESGVTHTHGPSGEHSHGEVAFTTWLDPLLALEQARAILEAFSRALPAHTADLERGFAALELDLRALDTQLAEAAKQLDGAPLLFSHPVYAYLERRYALNGRSLHWEPDAAPTDGQWRELDTLLETHPAHVLIWEAEPRAETRSRLESRGVQSVVYDPGANRGERGDWLAVMRANTARFAALSSTLSAAETP